MTGVVVESCGPAAYCVLVGGVVVGWVGYSASRGWRARFADGRPTTYHASCARAVEALS